MEELKPFRIPNEEMYPPVDRFNSIVAPIFNAVRINHDPHSSHLNKSLTWFLEHAFQHTRGELCKIHADLKEQGVADFSQFDKNLQYLRARRNYFLEKLAVPSILGDPGYTRQVVSRENENRESE